MIEQGRGDDDGDHRDETPRALEEPITHLFQVQLHGAELNADQVERVAQAIRSVARDELLAIDFRIEELTPLFKRRTEGGVSCGGACNSG